jgi:hypothetical protein
MPGPTILMHAAAWSQAAPAVALAGSGNWGQRGRRLAALACTVSLLGDGVNFVLSREQINNLWVGYVSTPASSALTLLALACWQTTARARRSFLLLIPAYLVVWALAIGLAEDLGRYSLIAFPVHSLILMACCLWTMGALALEEDRDSLFRTDAFWIAGGFALWAGTSAAVEPLMSIFVARDRIAAAFAVLDFKAALLLLGIVAITAGMLCPVTTAPSGPSSSPAR